MGCGSSSGAAPQEEPAPERERSQSRKQRKDSKRQRKSRVEEDGSGSGSGVGAGSGDGRSNSSGSDESEGDSGSDGSGGGRPSRKDKKKKHLRPNFPDVRGASQSGSSIPALPGRSGNGGQKGAQRIVRLTQAIIGDRLTEISKFVNRPETDVDALYSCENVPDSTLAFENATLLHIAVFCGKFSIAKFLLIKNADLNVICDHISDKRSRFHSVTAFHMVVALCSMEMIDLFLRSGASLGQPCREYVTYKYFLYSDVNVLHLACFRKDAKEVIELLLTKADQDPDILDALAGEIRPHNEKHSTDNSLVNLSQKNTKNKFRNVTCLHITVALNRKQLVRMLVEAGASAAVKCGEVSFKYKLNSHARELANANRSSGKPITHGFHSYEGSTVSQLAFQTERTDLVPLLKGWGKGKGKGGGSRR